MQFVFVWKQLLPQWLDVSCKVVRKRERKKRTLSTPKNERPLVGLFQQSKIVICCFVQNDGDDEDDNHILNGSKLSVTLSESTRCHGLTIFENEAVIKFSPLAFYSKMSLQITPPCLFGKVVEGGLSVGNCTDMDLLWLFTYFTPILPVQ